MGDAFRRLFLSIGVALGLATGQVDPSIVARVSPLASPPAAPERGALAVSARIDNAFAPSAIELVETGTRVALRYSIRLEEPGGGHRAVSETRSIWYDMRSGRYRVAFGAGKEAALVAPRAARGLAAELSDLTLGSGTSSSQAKAGSQIVVSAEIGIIDASGAWHDAPVLWNYFSPRTTLALSGADAAAKASAPKGSTQGGR
jgi:hypothetical protein